MHFSFILHGRLLWLGKKVVTNMLASLDPYNTSETVEWCWNDWGLEWAQGESLLYLTSEWETTPGTFCLFFFGKWKDILRGNPRGILP